MFDVLDRIREDIRCVLDRDMAVRNPWEIVFFGDDVTLSQGVTHGRAPAPGPSPRRSKA